MFLMSLILLLKKTWLIDFGVSDHIGCSRSMFKELRLLNNGYRIRLPDGTINYVNQVGSIELSKGFKLENILYVPDFGGR